MTPRVTAREANVSERQKPAEFQRPCEKRGALRIGEETRLDLLEGLVARRSRAIFVVEAGEVDLPAADDRGKLPVAAHAFLNDLAILKREYAQHIFAGENLIPGAVSLAFVGRCHRSMHSLSFSRLRLSHVRTVFSGTPN